MKPATPYPRPPGPRLSGLLSVGSAALLLCACQSQAYRHTAPTVANITRSNDMQRNRFALVKTPTILPIVKSKRLEPNAQAALYNYDQLVELAANPQIRAEALRRSADLRVQLADADTGGGDHGAELHIAVERYQRLLAEQPGYAHNDEVLYQLARADQLAGDTEPATRALVELGRRYPASQLAADAHFRAGELLFMHERYAQAEPEYRAVVEQGAKAPYFEPAQYKLAWSLYKQSKYEECLPPFLAILERELPQPAPQDTAAAEAAVGTAKADMVAGSLRASSLAFAALGGGTAINRHFEQAGEPRFYVLTYAALGSLLLEKHRYSDAAGAYSAFVERHPGQALAPAFAGRAIAAYRQGGFDDTMAQEEARYADRYAPGAAYWGGQPPSAEVMAELRKDLDELGPYYHARAQRAADAPARQTDFAAAAAAYRKLLEIFPNDPKAADTNLLYADALYDGGQTREAAAQYLRTAYGYAGNAKAPDAAYAAVQALQKLAQEAPAAEHNAVLRQSVEASLKLADSFPAHPQRGAVLVRAAADLYAIGELDQAVAVAGRALQADPALPLELRSQALAVAADARFAQNHYAEAETAYSSLLKVLPSADPGYAAAAQRLAASVYKQGEIARDAGDLRTAARHFLRVGTVVPDAGIRAGAEYDGAVALLTLQDWPAATQTLEAFRSRYPAHPLLGDVDKKLAMAYDKNNQPAAAAEVYARVAQRAAEPADTRRDAAWLSAQLFDRAALPQRAVPAYESYVAAYAGAPAPSFDRAMQARRRLADLARDGHDAAAYQRWLHEIVGADNVAGAARTDQSHLLAAQASLELARIDAELARAIPLNLPLAQSLARRKAATETAVAALEGAAAYGFADVTTAATYELGNVYRDFGQALAESQPPRQLQGEALEQYKLLLAEQADPFDQKAVAAYEANLQALARQDVWNDWVRRSAGELAALAPAKYGKHEQSEASYDSLR